MALSPDIVTIGESLIELSSNKSLKFADCFDKYYGGDTLVTAITALRLGSSVGYITKVGADSFREYLLESWQMEGLDISQVKLAQGYNGLYFVTNTENAEREFVYYRRKTATASLSIDDIDDDYIKNASCVYATGITQSISASCREAIRHAFKIAKENNVLVAYDPNYTPDIWDADEAKEAYEEIEEYIDIIFMNAIYDANALFGIDSPDKIIQYLTDKEVSTIVIKKNGYYTANFANTVYTSYYIEGYTDLTGASDSFNGAFLHAITNGMTEAEAAKLASVVASLQAQKLGAIRSIPTRNIVLEHFKGLDD